MANAWKLARENVERAQQHQKRIYDRTAKEPEIQAGDRVFIFMPAAKQGPSYKFARPFHGPYRVIENTILACPVGKPNSTPIHVSLNRVRVSPHQIADMFWPPNQQDDQPTLSDIEDDTSLVRDTEGDTEGGTIIGDTLTDEENTEPGEKQNETDESIGKDRVWTGRLRKTDARTSRRRQVLTRGKCNK